MNKSLIISYLNIYEKKMFLIILVFYKAKKCYTRMY